MSIRVKLILSYVLMTIIPIGLFILFLHLLFHLFLNNIEEMKEFYQVDDRTVEAFFYEELAAITELKQVAISSPDELLDESIISRYENLLGHRQIAIFVRKGDTLTNGQQADTSTFYSYLPAHQLSESDPYVNHQGQIGEDGQYWLYTGTDFRFADGDDGSLFFTLDVEPVSDFLTNIIPLVITGFIVAFILTNGVITYVISKHLIQPLKRLHRSAGEIASGNLNEQTGIVRNDEIGDLASAFEEMRLQLKQSVALQEKYDENRKELINNISHDLKTPITSIKGHIQGIIDGVARDQNKLDKYIQIIHTKASEMDQLIDELLLFSKLDLNSIPFHFECVNLRPYLRDIIEAFQLEYDEVEIESNVSIHPETLVLADRAQLYKVFANLLANSVKFMNQDEKRIHVHASERGQVVCISITDNGQGIEEKALPYVFDRFFRAEASRGTDQGGSGIGLAIVKQIVEAHEGMVEITSKVNEGTTIQFTLPIVDENKRGEKDEEDFNC
ncbi:sensor histidine kinase [Shouchella lehensis]|uniref:histidine kinase n=1 Tax=Shouchella lehensis G1 TaxID=1246626 RepID=A0A060LYU3_9BACI|nr:HAMP domain-containing sensor histidine kinase [Shouchella lehensis]AIC92969.1 sensor histidine kinase domain-containing protein [Shouchella lehensis G1]